MWNELLVKLVQALLTVLMVWLGGGCTAAVPSAAIRNYPPSVSTVVNQTQAGDGSSALVGPPAPATRPQ